MIHLETQNNAFPEDIFFIHGNLCSARFWELSFEELRKLSPQRSAGRLVAVDYPGCGKSTPPKDQSEVQIQILANKFIKVIEEHEIESCHLVGHSTGGLIAAVMLAKRPDLFKKTLLLDPVGAQGVAFNEVMLPTFEAMKEDRALTATIIGSTIYQNNPESDFFRNIVAEDAFLAVKNVGSWILQALDGIDFAPLLRTIKSPVLILHGEHDTLLPMADSETLAKIIPSAKFEVVKGQGHCYNVEDPKGFAARLYQFLCT